MHQRPQGERSAIPVTLIPGDGIGPDVTAAARRAIDATGVEIRWDVQDAGMNAFERSGSPLPEAAVRSIAEHGVALKGPLATPTGSGYRSPNIALRDALGLYVGVRPCKARGGASAAAAGTDLVVVRMLTEDLYAGIEFAPGQPDTARLRELVRDATGSELASEAGVSIKPISAAAAERVVRHSFEYAESQGRAKVTAVHKATVMRQTDGLFLNAARAVAAGHAGIEFEERLIDAACHDLVRRPGAYDVVVAPMMYGDILSDLGAGLIGGLGLAPGANFGDECAVFEAAHGVLAKHAGSGRANPMAAILSGAMLLRHVGEAEGAGRIERAVDAVLADGSVLTYDQLANRTGEAAGTSEVADAVVRVVEAGAS